MVDHSPVVAPAFAGASDLDLTDVARKTTGMTGAQLANALNEAAIIAGRAGRRAMAREDLDEALLRQSVGSQQARRLSPKERRIVAYHEAGHALCRRLLGLGRRAVRRGGPLSISGVYGGAVDPLPMLDLFDKGVQLRMGQAHVRRWVPEILPLLERAEDDLKRLLIPRDPRDDKNIYLEVRAGTGGDEAAIFAGDLFRMYSRYAERQGWGVEVLNLSETGGGGIKEVIALVEGKNARGVIVLAAAS